jgi:Ca2+:H+ antiporter
MLWHFLTNLQEVILGTKLAVLFPAIPLAIAADYYKFGRVSSSFFLVTKRPCR